MATRRGGFRHGLAEAERGLSSLPSLALWWHALEQRRLVAVNELLAARPELARETQRLLREGEGRPRDARLDQVARQALATLRAWPLDLLAPRVAWWVRAGVRVDRLLRSERPERMDAEDLPESEKRWMMRLLAAINCRLGSYHLWRQAVAEALHDLQSAHLHDVAAGAGAFVRYLARQPPPGLALTLTASDGDPTYVQLGASSAEGNSGRIKFERRDVAALASAPKVDLFVCTQAAHHLTPGQVVRLFEQATRGAARGLLLIDFIRSLTSVVAAAGALLLVAPYPVLLGDGVLSVRRSYGPSELVLLARLAGVARLKSRVLGPAHWALHAEGRTAEA
jgi:2-polyprenyl-3-methyl-5-hydroxy-6-metoxy-1,4-benzoquinol methylase